jgi:hypothetical protein
MPVIKAMIKKKCAMQCFASLHADPDPVSLTTADPDLIPDQDPIPDPDPG